MKHDKISWNGRITTPGELEIPFPELLTAHYIYQRVQLHGGKVPHLAEHLAIVSRTFWSIHRTRPVLDEETIVKDIAAIARENRYQMATGLTLLLCFFPAGDGADLLIMCEKPLIEKGYTVSSLRPVAVTHGYKLPYEGFPTNFLLSAARFHDGLALEFGATKSIRKEGDMLISCGDAPLFGIRGRTLFTASLTEGATDSVERRIVISAAAKAKLDFLEEAVPHSDLVRFDELFYADATGITSLGECDGAKFMSLYVLRITENIKVKIEK